jgi:Flp pilus assembly protein TadG
MNKKMKSHRREGGQSLVEFSVGMVFLLVLVVGITDTARAMFTYLSMRDAAQEGALYASVNPTDTAAIESRVRGTSNLMSGLGTNITVMIVPTVTGKLCLGATGGVSHGVVVTITYPNFPLTMPLIGAIVGSQTVGISASANNKIISPRCP